MNVVSVRNWQYQMLENNLKSVDSILRLVPPAALITYRDGGAGWTALELLCHLRDLEEVVIERARLTVEQENAPLPMPDPDALAAERRYNEQDVETVFAEWRARRTAYLTFLQNRADSDWDRVGLHPRRGPMTLLDQLIFLPSHDGIHIEQITRVLREQRNEESA